MDVEGEWRRQVLANQMHSIGKMVVVSFQSKLIVFWENMCNTCSTFAFSESGEYLGQHTVEE